MARRVFVSCGQMTEDERRLGREVAQVIRDHGMEPFFAQDVHSPNGLNAEVFEAVRQCDAFVAIMHQRGRVRFLKYPPSQRASTWVQQEIAILAYRMHVEGRQIPIRVYQAPGIRREGVIEAAIVNPIDFTEDAAVVENVAKWLEGAEFQGDPIASQREALFKKRTHELPDLAWELIAVLAAHTVDPGDWVPYMTVERDLRMLLQERGQSEVQARNEAGSVVGSLDSLGLLYRKEGGSPRQAMLLQLNPAYSALFTSALRARGQPE